MVKFKSVLIFFSMIAAALNAAVWTVPDSIATIQDAVSIAASGDTVLIMRSFQNRGRIEITGKSISLLSNNYIKNPSSYNFTSGVALYDTSASAPLLLIDHADSTVIMGLLFDLAGGANGGGVRIQDSKGVRMTGIYLKGNPLTLENSTVEMTHSRHYQFADPASPALSLDRSDLAAWNSVWVSQNASALLSAVNSSSLSFFNVAAYNNQFSSALIHSSASSHHYDFVTFHNNVSPDPAWSAAGSDITIENSVFSNALPPDTVQFFVRYSAIPGGFPGDGNLAEDPRIDPALSWPALSASSPCISSADPDTAGIPRKDLLGAKRPDPDWAPPDMGAYESPRHVLLNPAHHFFISTLGDDIWGNGSSGRPFAGVQRAVDYAQNGDTLIVLPGTYTGNVLISQKSLTLGSRFIFHNDPAAADSVMLMPDTAGYASVITVLNADSLAIRGLTLSGGSGHFYYNNYTYGGGLYCENSSCFLEQTKITNNRADFSGGGIFAYSSTIHLDHVELTDNAAYLGGAISLNQSTANIEYTVIRDNTASSGGGIFAENLSRAVLFYTDLSRNTAHSDSLSAFFQKPAAVSQYGGGLYATNSDLRFHNTLISENISKNKGGAIAVRSGVVALLQSTVAYNSALSDSCGILFFDQQSDPVKIVNSIVWNPDEIDCECRYTELDLSHSDLRGGLGGILLDGTRNDDITSTALFEADPLFGSEYRLSPLSPLLSSGIPQYVRNGYYLIDYEPSYYSGSAPGLGYAGADPPVSFLLSRVLVGLKPVPEDSELLGAYPNPFNPQTSLEFTLASPGNTELNIYNLRGEHVLTLLNAALPEGRYRQIFNASKLPSGVYLCRLEQDGMTIATQKLMLVK
ncbi:MAG: T9SS type A sorting domain-containing protein [Candidatus Marinimicrobia bacterium]|nr:T9SS type A sorting domain-containing protein [Candidatus Neomarinimicrobiota bacterium]